MLSLSERMAAHSLGPELYKALSELDDMLNFPESPDQESPFPGDASEQCALEVAFHSAADVLSQMRGALSQERHFIKSAVDG